MEPLTSLLSAVIGGSAAIGATWYSMRRVAKESSAESRATERSSLEALSLEIDVVKKIARAGSAMPLPTQMLTNALPGVHHMDMSAKGRIVSYSASIQRYNGRVQRLVAFRAAKRAGGREPGVTRVGSEHADSVCEAAGEARSAIQEQLDSLRLRGPKS